MENGLVVDSARCGAHNRFPSAMCHLYDTQGLASPNAFIYREVIEHIAPKFARPALVVSESAWPSTRRAYGLAYRDACRHARRSTANPRDAVHAPHGQVGPPPPTGAARGRARPCAPLCRRLTRLAASLRTESLPSAAIRRPKRLFSRFSSVASRFSELAGLFSTVADRCKRLSSLSCRVFRPKRRCIFAYSEITVIT